MLFVREFALIVVGMTISLVLLLELLSDYDVQLLVRIPKQTDSNTLIISKELHVSGNTTTQRTPPDWANITSTDPPGRVYQVVSDQEELNEIVNGSTFHQHIPFDLFLGAANGGDWQLPLCPIISPNIVGLSVVSEDIPSLSYLMKQHKELQSGGRWQPSYCSARHRVAIIIPYRNREQQLHVFLKHMHPFLQRQQLGYSIIVVEQTNSSRFNRAMLMNIGATHAAELYDSQCYVLHDVDLLPEDDRTLYACPKQPLHMSAAIKNYNYTLIYDGNFGGVVSINRKQFEQINGLSNLFFGWGGEDDDFRNRVTTNYLTPGRYTENLARYTMITHKSEEKSDDRVPLVMTGQMRYNIDGLNSLLYKTLKVEKLPLYTRVLVDIDQEKVMETVPKLFRELPPTLAPVPTLESVPTKSLLLVDITETPASPDDQHAMAELTPLTANDHIVQLTLPESNASPVETALPASNDLPAETALPASNDSPAETALPASNDSPAETALPASNDSPAETALPASNDSPAETALPASNDSPAETALPASNDLPAETALPASNDPPAETALPVSNDSPAETALPASNDSPAETALPASNDSPVETALPASKDSPAETALPASNDSPVASAIESDPHVNSDLLIQVASNVNHNLLVSDNSPQEQPPPLSSDSTVEATQPVSSNSNVNSASPEINDAPVLLASHVNENSLEDSAPSAIDITPLEPAPSRENKSLVVSQLPATNDTHVGTGAAKNHDSPVGTRATENHDSNVETGATEYHDSEVGTGATENHKSAVGLVATENNNSPVEIESIENHDSPVGSGATENHDTLVVTNSNENHDSAIRTEAKKNNDSPVKKRANRES